jgi:hypothetical protein
MTDRNFENISFISAELADIEDRIKNNIGIDVKINNPYKLCDFRPAFGLIFKDLLTESEFWGWCDLDIVLGDMEKFLPTKAFSSNDAILRRGHFFLIKNSDKNNDLFKTRITNQTTFQEIASSSKNYIFDELGFNRILDKEEITRFNEYICADIDPSKCKLGFNKWYKANNHKSQSFAWKNGKILQLYDDSNVMKTKEWAYIHLQKRKLGKIEYKENADYIFAAKGIYPQTISQEYWATIKSLSKTTLRDEILMAAKNLRSKIKNRIENKIVYEK